MPVQFGIRLLVRRGIVFMKRRMSTMTSKIKMCEDVPRVSTDQIPWSIVFLRLLSYGLIMLVLVGSGLLGVGAL